jgi:peptide deformylase
MTQAIETNILGDGDVITFNTADHSHGVQKAIETFELVSEDDPILRESIKEFKNPPVDPADFASSMVETCIKNNGYGLSANQCGFKHRMFVMGAGTEYVAFFNPKIVKTEGEAHMQEGCLSFPMLGLTITRPKEIWVEYQDFTGAKKEAHFVGLSARCFQHELDHMDGILYTSRAKPLALQSGMKKRGKLKKMIDRSIKATSKLVKASKRV